MSINIKKVDVHKADSVVVGRYVRIRFEGESGYQNVETQDPEILRLMADEISEAARYLEGE